MKTSSHLTLSSSPQLQPTSKPHSFAKLSLRQRTLCGKTRRCFTVKELDSETGLYYYGARYLDPKTSRWLSGDPAVSEYIPSAPVNDEARKRNGNLPGMGGVFNYVNLHVYHYAGNNPVKLVDPDGRTSEKKTIRRIQENIINIKNAAEEFGVDPVAIAGCIYAEQRLNVNFIDTLTDLPFYFIDTSVGLGQVKISTARMLEDEGLIEKTESFFYANVIAPTYISREELISYKLSDDKQNIRYVAAYLKHHQDRWRNEFPEIGERPDILGTLFNRGDRPPRATPESNSFGDYVKNNYEHVKNILGIE